MLSSNQIYEDVSQKLRIVLDDLKCMARQKDDAYSGEGRQKTEREIDRKASQATTMIKDLESEVYRAPMSCRAGMTRHIRKLKSDLDSIERELANRQQHNAGVRRQHAEVGGGSFGGAGEQSLVLQGHRSMTRAQRSIERSNVIAADSERIGDNILTELDGQRDQLHRVHDLLDSTDSHVSRARKLIVVINRTVLTNKIVLLCIIISELAGLGLAVYFRFYRHGKS